MDGNPDNPAQQLAAAWQAAGDALDEWRQRVAAATTDAAAKLDPALRAAVEAARAAMTGDWKPCHCPCGSAHPADRGVCDGRAVVAGASATRTCPSARPAPSPRASRRCRTKPRLPAR